MNVAMLGGYHYALLPAYASPLSGYVKSSRYLGADLSLAIPTQEDFESHVAAQNAGTVNEATSSGTSSSFLTNLKDVLSKGSDVAIEWLKTRQANAATEAERIRASSALSDIQAGRNPLAQSDMTVPLLMAGGVAILAVIVLSKRKRR